MNLLEKVHASKDDKTTCCNIIITRSHMCYHINGIGAEWLFKNLLQKKDFCEECFKVIEPHMVLSII